MKTVEEADKILEQFSELQDMAVPIAEIMLTLELDRPCVVDAEEITAEDGFLYVTYEEYHCGDTDTFKRCIPTEYLFDPDWEKKANAELARRHEEKQEKKRLAAEKAKRDKEDQERREYMKLKAKFEK